MRKRRQRKNFTPRRMYGENKHGFSESVLSEESPWLFQEAYKTLRTNIAFSVNGEDKKIIGITSATPKDGKSTNAINLAISFSQIGKKVVLIGADMRLPSLEQQLKMEIHKNGLSRYLAKQKKFDECIFRDVIDGVDVIPSGEIPPDPTWLLQSDMMIDLLKKLKDEYDYIIIDFPPVNTVSDAYILSRLIDSYLFVYRIGVTEKKEIQKALEHLQMAEAKIIGFVENGVRVHEKEYYSNYYYAKK